MTFLSSLTGKCRTLSMPSLWSTLVRLCPERGPAALPGQSAVCFKHCTSMQLKSRQKAAPTPSAEQSADTDCTPVSRVITDVMALLLSKMTQSVLTDWLGRLCTDGFGLINTIITYIQTGMAKYLPNEKIKQSNKILERNGKNPPRTNSF